MRAPSLPWLAFAALLLSSWPGPSLAEVLEGAEGERIERPEIRDGWEARLLQERGSPPEPAEVRDGWETRLREEPSPEADAPEVPGGITRDGRATRAASMLDLSALVEGAASGGPPESGLSPREVVTAKLEAGEELLLHEFLLYVRLLEASRHNRSLLERSYEATRDETLPARGWALLVTRMHASQYAADRAVSFGPVELFKDGSENLGWEEVDLLAPRAPKFVRSADGERIDIAHAYAGIAALVMRRNRVWGNITSSANTQLGDRLQVAGGVLGGLKDTALGILDRDRRETGLARVREAGDFLPPAQRHGNLIGFRAHDYLQKNREGFLSTALGMAADHWRETRSD